VRVTVTVAAPTVIGARWRGAFGPSHRAPQRERHRLSQIRQVVVDSEFHTLSEFKREGIYHLFLKIKHFCFEVWGPDRTLARSPTPVPRDGSGAIDKSVCEYIERSLGPVRGNLPPLLLLFALLPAFFLRLGICFAALVSTQHVLDGERCVV